MNFIVFDLEATCWRGRPPKGITEIIEIGAIKINRYGEEVERFSRFVRPVVNPLLSGFCKRLTHISQENVDRAETFQRVCHDFIDWAEIYDEDYLMLSWGADDRRLLYNDCKLHRLEGEWVNQYMDLKNAYARMKNLRHASGLKSTVKREGFEFTGIHHRAISDAENLAKVFVKNLDDWDLVY